MTPTNIDTIATNLIPANICKHKAIKDYANAEKEIIKEEASSEEELNLGPIARLVQNSLENDVRMKASDIHVEHEGDYESS